VHRRLLNRLTTVNYGCGHVCRQWRQRRYRATPGCGWRRDSRRVGAREVEDELGRVLQLNGRERAQEQIADVSEDGSAARRGAVLAG
jgi:hypothetical protein